VANKRKQSALPQAEKWLPNFFNVTRLIGFFCIKLSFDFKLAMMVDLSIKGLICLQIQGVPQLKD
jgi:hypothetical protein